MASRQGYVRAPLDAAHLYANTTQRHEPSRETSAAFACTTGIEVSRDLVLLSAGASARVAYCGPLRSASRVAQPWSLRVRAWVVAIGSLIVCGDARGGIKPRPNVFPNPLLHFHQGSRQIVIEQFLFQYGDLERNRIGILLLQQFAMRQNSCQLILKEFGP